MYNINTVSRIIVYHIIYTPPPLLIPLSTSQYYHVHKKHRTWLGLAGTFQVHPLNALFDFQEY